MGANGSTEVNRPRSDLKRKPLGDARGERQLFSPATHESPTLLPGSQTLRENAAAAATAVGAHASAGVHGNDAGDDARGQKGTECRSPLFVPRPESTWPTSDAARSPPLPTQFRSPLPSIPSYSSEFLEASPVTPVLRSYHRHSFSQSSGAAVGSPLSTTSSPVTPLIHTRFLEINGYPAGLENYGNTCYCNAVLQLLYHCSPLRLRLLELHEMFVKGKIGASFKTNTVLWHLADLFAKMHKANNSKKMRKVTVSPKELLACVRSLNTMFDNGLQHDAHEFAMFVLNNIIEAERRVMSDEKNHSIFSDANGSKALKWKNMWRRRRPWRRKECSTRGMSPGELGLPGDALELPPALRNALTSDTHRATFSGANSDTFEVRSTPSATVLREKASLSPLQVILSGQFASLTACCECERVTVMREAFTDLSLDIQQGSSLRQCVANFGAPELFHGDNKLHCDHCKKQVVAQKIIRVHRLPEYALLVHLKRFQYDEKNGEMEKKSVHVALPREIDMVEYEPCEEMNCDADNHNDNSSSGVASETGVDHFTMSPPLQSSLASSSAAAAAAAADGTPRPSARLAHKLAGMAHRKGRFALSGFVTHVGRNPNAGHYFTCVRHGEQWRRFDDTTVTELTEGEMRQYWGVPIPVNGSITATAYILLYERVA